MLNQMKPLMNKIARPEEQGLRKLSFTACHMKCLLMPNASVMLR